MTLDLYTFSAVLRHGMEIIRHLHLKIQRRQINSPLDKENGFSHAPLFILQINFGYNVKSFQFSITSVGHTFVDTPSPPDCSISGLAESVVLAMCLCFTRCSA
jgi:hypothetical protein